MNPLSTLQRPREHDEHSHRPPFRSPYDPQQPQYAPQDMDAQLSMAYLPLPVDTPLPASAFAVPNAGYNHPTHNPQQGPTGHPLYEGVLGMHYLLSQGMPWAEYSGHNSSRNDSRNDDDLFCQNPAPLVPLPIRPTASRLSSRSSLQSWQSDCTEQESHPEPSSSFQGSPLSTAMSNTTATTPTHSSEGSATFHVEVRDYMRPLSRAERPPTDCRSQGQLLSLTNPTPMPQDSSEKNSAIRSGIFSLLVSPRVAKVDKSRKQRPPGA